MQRQQLADYYENGRLRTQSYWDDQMGIIQGFREDGTREFEVIIKNGIRISRKVFGVDSVENVYPAMA